MHRAWLPNRLSILQLLVTLFVVIGIVIAGFARGAGTDLPTSSMTLAAGDVAIWLTHDSPTTQIWGSGARDKHRIIRWASDGLYSSRKTYAVFGFRLIQGTPGRMYDFHTQPDDVGGWTPPCTTGVAPLAIDYWGTGLGLHAVAQAEDSGCSGGSGNFHFQIMSQSEIESRRGQWVWLWSEITWGRRDIGTKGALKIWVAGEDNPRVNVSGINTHWSGEQMITFWEGQYDSSKAKATNVVEIAATRFGRTPQEAFDDRPVLFSREPASAPNSSSVAIASRSASEAAVPSSISWGSAPPPPPPPAPAPPPPPPAPPANPKLNVKKVVVGATTSPSAFSFTVSNGGGTHSFEADGQNQLTLSAGTYTVTEPAVSGWTTTYAGCSSIALSAGQSTVPTCTITNTKEAAPAPPPPPPAPPANPKLNVKKVVVGATTSPSAFSFTVSNGGGTHSFEADGQNQLTLSAGTYTVTEPAVSGWTTTYAGCSSIALSAGQSTVPTCTITNTKEAAPAPPPPPPAPPANPKLNVKKVVVGATTSPSAFSFTVSNGGGTHSFEADGQNQLTLSAGTYTVTEPAVSGWTTTYAGCSSIALSAGQSTVPTCTITNTKEAAPAPPPPPPAPPANPKLNVKKVVVGATTSPSAFSFTVSNGGGTHSFEADGQNQLTLSAGTYTVTEPAVSGWTTTYAGCSSIALSAGQSTVPTCTITNTKEAAPAPPPPPPAPPANPKLNVKKVVVGATTSPSAFSFTVSNGGGTHSFEADGQNQLTLSAGTYTVTEPAVSGWTTTYAGCSSIALSAGQSTVPTCTITNTKEAAPAPPEEPTAPSQPPVSAPLPPASNPLPPVSAPLPPASTPLPPVSAPLPPASDPRPAPAPLVDRTRPSTPGALRAAAGTRSAVLSWSASTDDVGVIGYGIYESGKLVDSQPELTATLLDLRCGTWYLLGVDAYDRAGNRSQKAVTVVLTERCNGNGWPPNVKRPWWLPDVTPRGHAGGPGGYRGGWSIFSRLSTTIGDRLSRLVTLSATVAATDAQGVPSADGSARASHDVSSPRADAGVQRVPSDTLSTRTRTSILTVLSERFAAWSRAVVDSGLSWRRQVMRQYALDHRARFARTS